MNINPDNNSTDRQECSVSTQQDENGMPFCVQRRQTLPYLRNFRKLKQKGLGSSAGGRFAHCQVSIFYLFGFKMRNYEKLIGFPVGLKK